MTQKGLFLFRSGKRRLSLVDFDTQMGLPDCTYCTTNRKLNKAGQW
jgi:hypothetical protein